MEKGTNSYRPLNESTLDKDGGIAVRDKMNMSQIIRDVILDMERPFRLSDLFIRLDRKGITNREYILEALAELVESGLVSYSEVEDDCWAYSSIFSHAAS